MKNFFKLNLPSNPIREIDLSKYWSKNSWQIETDVKKILTDEILDCLSKINLTPILSVFFTVTSNQRHNEHHYAHTDLTLLYDRWTSVPFAINWELNKEITTTICWYDTSKCIKKMPTENEWNKKYPFNYLNGAFYEGEKQIIETVTLNTHKDYYPILFRTDVAHAISSFKTTESNRMCFSLRFDIEKISSWEQATNIFKEFIVISE